MKPIYIAGSSIMEQWPNYQNLIPGRQIKNIAVGGSTTLDWALWLDQRIPTQDIGGIIFYCGSNDFNQGYPPGRIFERTVSIWKKFHGCHPQIPFVHLHVIRAPQKKESWSLIDALKEDLDKASNVFPKVVTSDPNPVFIGPFGVDQTLFLDDALHLTAGAYQKWEQILRPFLENILFVS